MSYQIYAAEFKMKAIQDYLESSLTVRKYSESINVSFHKFYSCYTKYRKSMSTVNPSNLIDITREIKNCDLRPTEERVIKLRIKDIKISVNESALPIILRELKSW